MNEQWEYEVKRSKRATKPRIDVDLHGIKITIPADMDLEPEQLIAEKRDWIEKKREELRELRSRIPERNFEPGARWPYRGEFHELVVKDVGSSTVQNGTVVLAENRVEQHGIREELEQWYRREARGFIEEIVDEYTGKLGVDYDTVRIKNQKTLWGSCSSKNNLNFNWRLIMAPPEVGEYVVIHEVCHLREPNHSPAFWDLLSEHCVAPKRKARWLKEHAVELIFTEEDL